MLSNSQLTKLGERLRVNELEDDDLQMLEAFRQTFSDIDEVAYRVVRDTLKLGDELVITKRKRKTQQSIVDKLRRQNNLRLPQMQDIAGCRIVLQSGAKRSHNISSILTKAFTQLEFEVQRKERHAFGYRAIHVIVKIDKKFYEIQLRTYAQDVWANLVESLSNEQYSLKYGGNEKEQVLVKTLERLSDRLSVIDGSAHMLTFEDYRKQIQEVIQDVLSH